jgi:hypothetical protein
MFRNLRRETQAREQVRSEEIAMTIRKELIVSLDDIRFIRISCPHCNTTLRLMLGEIRSQTKQGITFVPDACSVCRQPIDSAIDRVAIIQLAYHQLASLGKDSSSMGKQRM